MQAGLQSDLCTCCAMTCSYINRAAILSSLEVNFEHSNLEAQTIVPRSVPVSVTGSFGLVVGLAKVRTWQMLLQPFVKVSFVESNRWHGLRTDRDHSCMSERRSPVTTRSSIDHSS